MDSKPEPARRQGGLGRVCVPFRHCAAVVQREFHQGFATKSRVRLSSFNTGRGINSADQIHILAKQVPREGRKPYLFVQLRGKADHVSHDHRKKSVPRFPFCVIRFIARILSCPSQDTGPYSFSNRHACPTKRLGFPCSATSGRAV